MLTLAEIAAAVAATKGAVEIFDKVAGQIKTVLTKREKCGQTRKVWTDRTFTSL